MTAPAVSVIIPAYNAEALLGEAVESVRRQTYQDLEVLIVDDGSTDGTWGIIQALAAQWPAVRAFRFERNRGLAAARNRAVAEMRGRWIALLDADDVWLPEKLQRCMDFLSGHPDLSIVYSPMAPILPDGTAMKGHSKPCQAGQLTRKLFGSIFVHDPAAVLHKRVIERCGGFDESLPVSVGHEFWLRVSTQFEFGLIDEPLALRRWSERTLTRSNRSRGRQIKAEMLERFYFQRGGGSLIPASEALPRLAEVFCAAGRILLAEGQYAKAKAYLRKGIGYRPGCLRAYPMYAAAWMMGLLRKDA